MTFVLDWARKERTGVAEAILCEGKEPADIDAILAHAADRPLLLTRLSPGQRAALSPQSQQALNYDQRSRTAITGALPAPGPAAIAIVAAGTSDLGVAGEAARTLAFAGYGATIISDVGVAGLWRLTDRLADIKSHHVVIAMAGMEGALFSVLAGLIDAPIVAVPTSNGYGVANGGEAALSSALASCAPGLTVVNIDNGFGAACAAIRIVRRIAPTTP